MKRAVCALMVAGFAASSAFGGVVSMVPASVDVEPGGDIVFTLGVESADLASMNLAFINFGSTDLALDALIGDLEALGSAFVFNTDFESAMTFVAPAWLNPADHGHAHGWMAGASFSGSNLFSDTLGAPFTIGTLTIPTTGLAEGAYSFEADGEVASFARSTTEGLGLATAVINVVPEPASLMLLGLGALGLLRRRKA